MTRASRKKTGLPQKLGKSLIGFDPAAVEEAFQRQALGGESESRFFKQLIRAEQTRQEQLRAHLASVEGEIRAQEAQAAQLETVAKMADDTGEIIRDAVQRYLRVLEGEAAERLHGLEAQASELKERVRGTIRQLEQSAEHIGTTPGGQPASNSSPSVANVPRRGDVPAPALPAQVTPPTQTVPPTPAAATPPPAERVPLQPPAKQAPPAGGRVVLFRMMPQQGEDESWVTPHPQETFEPAPEPVLPDAAPADAPAAVPEATAPAAPTVAGSPTVPPSIPPVAQSTALVTAPEAEHQSPISEAPKAPASPPPSSVEQVAAGIKNRVSVSMSRLLEGKAVGQDLRDDAGALVAARGTLITPELTARVEAVGLLPDLILHMVWPEDSEA